MINRYFDKISVKTWEDELIKNSIDYYFLFDVDYGYPIPPLSQYKEITGGALNGLKIYSLKY